MADDTSEDMNMAAFVGSYLSNNNSVPSSPEHEKPAEADTLFCTPDREEESEINKPFSLGNVPGWVPVSQRINRQSVAGPLPHQQRYEKAAASGQHGTPVKRGNNPVSERQRTREEETAIPSIERQDPPVTKAGMEPPPKPAANTEVSQVDAQTEFLRSLMSKPSNTQKQGQRKRETQTASVETHSTSTLGKQDPVQIKTEPRDDVEPSAIPDHVRPPPVAAAGSKRSISVMALEHTPPAKRIRLQALSRKKTNLQNLVDETKAQIEVEKKAHEDRIAQFAADKKALEAVRAEQEAEFQKQEEDELRQIQELEDINQKLDQKLQRQRAVQQEQLAFWREERQQLGINSDGGESSAAEDDVEEEQSGEGVLAFGRHEARIWR